VRFLFLASPFVGPGLWRAATDVANDLGHPGRIVDLRGVVSARGPDLDEARRSVRAALGPTGRPGERDDPGSLILVPHSGAGLLVPWIVDGLDPRPVATVFVDAGLPDRRTSVEIAAPALRDPLRSQVNQDGLLPPWFGWWGPGALEALVPDRRRRRSLEAEMPPIPIAYLEASVPVPARWPQVAGAYLGFGDEAYASEIRRARAWGWPVSVLENARHLHMAVEPERVAREILSLAEASVRGDR